MNPRTPPTQVAITGSSGFLGRALTSVLAPHFPLRVLDIHPTEGPWEQMVGSVEDLDTALKLCSGCSDLVIAHMAPNRPEIYDAPPIPFNVNVKGTANLFHAACIQGLRRVILISSTAVVQGHVEAGIYLTHDMPLSPISSYGLTKALQEHTAEYYHRKMGLEVAALRPAHICSRDPMVDKYGRKFAHAGWHMIDPLDIAEAVRLALIAPRIGYETLYIYGHPAAELHADTNRICEVLGWQPRYIFESETEEHVL